MMKKLIILCLVLFIGQSLFAQWTTLPTPAKRYGTIRSFSFWGTKKIITQANVDDKFLSVYDAGAIEFYQVAMPFTNFDFNNGYYGKVSVQSINNSDTLPVIICAHKRAYKINPADWGDSTEIKFLDAGGNPIFSSTENFGLFFFDIQRGFAISDDTTGGCNKIYTTEDGGLTWSKVNCENIMITPMLGAAGFGGILTNNIQQFDDKIYIKHPNKTDLILRISEWGKRWNERSLPLQELDISVKNIAFKDSLHGLWLPFTATRRLYRTNDGGLTWDEIGLSFNYPSVLRYAKPSGNKKGFYIIAEGNPAGSYISSDDGDNWYRMDDYKHDAFNFYDATWGISNESNQNNVGNEVKIFTGTDIFDAIEEKQGLLSFSLYPNPAKEKITLNGTAQLNITNAEALDISGRSISVKAELQNNSYQINVANLPQGIYALRLTTEKGVVFKKFMKE